MSNRPSVPAPRPAGSWPRVSSGRSVPQLDTLDAYNVNRAGQTEGLWAPLYDYQTYPAAGTTAPLTFFQSPLGSTRTLEDTNMTLGGQIPAAQEFLITSVGVNFLAGSPVTAFAQGTTLNSQPQDTSVVLKRGVLSLSVGSKKYIEYGPLMEFPPASRLGGFAALSDATTPAANLRSQIAYAQSNGPAYSIAPVRLIASQNFVVNITFPSGAVPLPSGDANSKIGVILYGFLYRLSQ